MKTKDIVNMIDGFFDTRNLEQYGVETGITYDAGNDIETIAYCTNLTLETVEMARVQCADLIITHHDAWDFIYGLREACVEKLKTYGISHYFNHLPLDDCAFGTNNSLVELLDAEIVEYTHEEDGFLCGRIAELKNEMTFEDLVLKLEGVLGEPVQAWKFKEGHIRRIGLVCGGGGLTPHLKEAADKGAEVYITGEKVLYTIEYAQFRNMNLIIGSHTFTEIFGVENLVKKLAKDHKELKLVRLDEEHLEAKTGLVRSFG